MAFKLLNRLRFRAMHVVVQKAGERVAIHLYDTVSTILNRRLSEFEQRQLVRRENAMSAISNLRGKAYSTSHTPASSLILPHSFHVSNNKTKNFDF